MPVWNQENIESSPNNIGLFILRSSPVNGAIVLVRISNNLKSDLLDIFHAKSFPETTFFEWYETESTEEAETLKKDWGI